MQHHTKSQERRPHSSELVSQQFSQTTHPTLDISPRAFQVVSVHAGHARVWRCFREYISSAWGVKFDAAGLPVGTPLARG